MELQRLELLCAFHAPQLISSSRPSAFHLVDPPVIAQTTMQISVETKEKGGLRGMFWSHTASKWQSSDLDPDLSDPSNDHDCLWDGASFCCSLYCCLWSVLEKQVHRNDLRWLLKCKFQDSYIPQIVIFLVGPRYLNFNTLQGDSYAQRLRITAIEVARFSS